MIIGGSYGQIGACVLGARAALKTGRGLVSAYLPGCAYFIMQSSLTEAMCLTDPSENYISQIPDLSSYSAVAIGMGIGQHPKTEEAFLTSLSLFPETKLIIDADALNILSKQKNPFEHLPKHSISPPIQKNYSVS
ncbi:ADP-dependent NAD(P)H-hydrate dehydratase [Elizabethkingia argenteiflava]|uniref:ADP-dependent NAD(P)H-hydrate dehydratase n=1 Tax=Elizabethkingia argenteiflava TaxID=2681556 RepID=UPI0021CFD4B9|nr:NAD(P)H-hydrate dehydratase [Elizabethkingia argenteiflava]